MNKGLALFQWKQDSAAAETLCREALVIDPECEAAVATLAQLSLQKGNIEAAVELFSRHADIARSEPELINALTYKYVSLLTSPAILAFFLVTVCSCVRLLKRKWSLH